MISVGKSSYGRSWWYRGGCWPEVLIPSGKMDLGSFFSVEGVWDGYVVVSAGAMVERVFRVEEKV